MEPRYERNRIHISEEAQSLIKNYKILIAGCGIGSYIAECLLRMGFESLTIIDGDKVELSNLNRQNYTEQNIGISKAIALKERLLQINKAANIKVITDYITIENLQQLTTDYKVAINALDFSTNVPFLFDELFCRKGIPVIHPYNLGWAGFVTVITNKTATIESLKNEQKVFELNIGKFITEGLQKKGIATRWFEEFLIGYEKVADHDPPPQLSIGVFLLAGMIAQIIFDIATGKPIKKFPDFYYLSLQS